jgi:hypothetical protein
LSEARSDIREPDEELTGPQPETVHMACMRDHHHYTVYRDMNDGEGPSQNDISYNGIYRDNDGIHWAYKEEFVECSDPTGCGLPVENHWENGEPAEWLENAVLYTSPPVLLDSDQTARSPSGVRVESNRTQFTLLDFTLRFIF